MQKTKNLIEHIFTKKNIKIFLLLFVVVWFFVWTSFADSSTSMPDKILKDFSNILRIIISILSWGRILLASLAWKFMTNELVYWTFLNLDKVLWNLWNIVKNFANFVLWFILLFSIVKNIFFSVKNDANPLKNAKDTVQNVLIAWVLVQMSWFLMWMALDISTVATAMVWSIPSQIISNNSSSAQNNLTRLISSNQTKLEIDFDEADMVKAVKTWQLTEIELRQIVDTITPSANSVIWPLIFLWGSVFDLFEASDTSHIEDGSLTWGSLFLTLWVNWFVIISFTVMMAFIFIFNLFRVITLRIIIPLSPFIILMKVLNPKGDKLKIDWFFWEVLSLKNVFNLIFKPVYMVLVLWLILIVMTVVKGLVQNNNWRNVWVNYWNVNISSNRIGEGDAAVYNSSMNVDWFLDLSRNGAKNTIVDLIVYILWLILMVILAKSCVTSKTGIKFVDNTMDNRSKTLWWGKWEFGWLLWNMWVIPVKDENGKTIKLWIWNTINARKNNDVFYNKMSKNLWINTYKQEQAMRERLKIKENSSFSELNPDRKPDEWMGKAVQIWKTRFNDFGKFWSDTGFEEAKNKFLQRYPAERNSIQSKLSDIWNVNQGNTEKVNNSKT